MEIAATRPSIYLDLEAREDRDKLADPALFLKHHEEKLVILDEIHRVPELFQTLRGLIDQGRRMGLRTGRFLVLGSAAIDLLRQSGESLAGRIEHVELGPLNVLETAGSGQDTDRLWLRGGFPDSYLAARPTKGFYHSLADLKPTRAFVVHAGEDRYPFAEGVEAISLPELAGELAAC